MRFPRLSCPLVLVPFLALLTPSAAAAQDTGHRQDFWLNGGLGSGFDEEIRWGGSGYVRLGTTLGSHFLVGGQVMQFRDEVESIQYNPNDPTNPDVVEGTRTKTNVGAVVTAYPSANGSFFVKAGVGYGRVEASVDAEDVTVSVSEDVFGTNIGVGHDFQLGDGNLYLTPNIDAILLIPDLEVSNTDATFLFTVGIGFY